MTNTRSNRVCCSYLCSVTSYSHTHEHVHPHADAETDLERVQRLAMFLESHFGEVHMNVPELEKGREGGQDEGTLEPVLLIRLDEADALVHLGSMVSCRILPSPLSLSFLGQGLRGSGKFT